MNLCEWEAIAYNGNAAVSGQKHQKSTSSFSIWQLEVMEFKMKLYVTVFIAKKGLC